jgi:hypothetical protein
MALPIICLPGSTESEKSRIQVSKFSMQSSWLLALTFGIKTKNHLSGDIGYGSFPVFPIRHITWRTRLFVLEVSNIG